MKIAFLAFTSIPKLGGAQIFAYNLAQNLTHHSHQIHFYLPRKYYNLIIQLPVDQSIKFKPILFAENWIAIYAPKIIYLSLFFRQLFHRYQLWQVIGVYPAGFISSKLSIRVPVVLRAHGDDIQKDESLGYGLRLNKSVEKNIKQTLNQVTALVALTKTVIDCYTEFGVPVKKIIKIPNGIEFDRFQKHIDRKRIRDRLGILEDESLILSVGRYHNKKGYEVLFDTSKILIEKGLKFKWLVVGKGVTRLKYHEKIVGLSNFILLKEEVNLTFTGKQESSIKVPSEELIDLYKSSDVFVLPSLLETFGMVLIEAMASGIPVVTTDAPGCRDVVTHKINGLLSKPGDPVSLSENIDCILNNELLRKRLSSNAILNAKGYDYSLVATQYFKLYEQLITTK